MSSLASSPEKGSYASHVGDGHDPNNILPGSASDGRSSKPKGKAKASRKRARSSLALAPAPAEDPAAPCALNVGGRVFLAARSTLLRDPHSLLARASPAAPLLFDRDAALFRFVLNFLREGAAVVLPTSESDRAALLVEARFYALQGLVDLLERAAVSSAAEGESFLTARPSADGYFYLADVRVLLLWPELAALALLDAHAVLAFRFVDASELSVVAIVAHEGAGAAVVPLAHARLAVTARAVASVQLVAGALSLTARVEFWWRAADAQSEYPQLCAGIARRDWRATGVLDFMHASALTLLNDSSA